MIEHAVTYLVNTDRFFADFIQQMDRVYTDKVATAGISVGKRITLYINPTFWAKWPVKMQAAILKHEAIHMICGHQYRAEMYYKDNKELHDFYNICMDLSTNCYVPEISHKDGFITVAGMHEAGYTTLKADQPFEYYVGYFQKEREEIAKMRAQAGSADEHIFDKDADGEPDEVRDRTVKHAVGEALDAARRAGKEPSTKIQDIVGKLFRGRNEWRREMRRFPQDAEVVAIESTRNRRNRRYGIIQPGDKKIRKVKVGLAFDVSGSMIDEKTMKALGEEIGKILDAGCELHAMFFDTGVTCEIEIKDVKDLAKYNHVGGGGTAFQPVLTRTKELGLDGLVMLTDGYNFDGAPLVFPKCPVLWGIINNDKYVPEKGKVIYVKPEE